MSFMSACVTGIQPNKSGELNDYSVCTTWDVGGGKYYLLDVSSGVLTILT